MDREIAERTHKAVTGGETLYSVYDAMIVAGWVDVMMDDGWTFMLYKRAGYTQASGSKYTADATRDVGGSGETDHEALANVIARAYGVIE